MGRKKCAEQLCPLLMGQTRLLSGVRAISTLAPIATSCRGRAGPNPASRFDRLSPFLFRFWITGLTAWLTHECRLK